MTSKTILFMLVSIASANHMTKKQKKEEEQVEFSYTGIMVILIGIACIFFLCVGVY